MGLFGGLTESNVKKVKITLERGDKGVYFPGEQVTHTGITQTL